MEHNYQVQVVKSPKAFCNLSQEWDEFAEQCGDDTFFSRSIFVQEAWQLRAGKQQYKMHLILVRQGEELVFAMPLYVSRKWFDKASLKWLDSMTPSFCNNILIKKTTSIDDIALLLPPHFRSLFRLQWLKVPRVLEHSATDKLLRRLGAKFFPYSTSLAMNIATYEDWSTYLKSRSSKNRLNDERLFRRLSDLGQIHIEQISDAEKIQEKTTWLFEKKREWAAERSVKDNWVSRPETEEYFTRTTCRLSPHGRGFVLSMSCGDEVVAALSGYQGEKTVFMSKMAYNPKFQKFSPGWLLVLECCKYSIERKYTTIDLGMGESFWKSRISTQLRGVNNCLLKF